MSGARPDTWMPWHIGKYLADTMHLTTEQHGAYLLLLAAGWMRNGSLPDDDGQLAAIVRLPQKRWMAMRPTLAAFFMIGSGEWRQKRQVEELEKATALTNARSEAGKKGGRPKASDKQTDKQKESRALANEEAGLKQNETPIPIPLPSKKESSASVCTDPPSPAVAVIQIFDEARATAFGETQRRSWPTGTDRTVAERWLAAGATLEICRDVCSAQCARMAAKGKRPPDSLALFERDIADAIAATKQPMPPGKAANGRRPPSDDGEERREANRDRLRLEAWQNGTDWNPNWGPEPPAEQRRKSA